MKKIIILTVLLLSFVCVSAQYSTTFTKPIKVENKVLSGTKIDGYDATKTKVDGAVSADTYYPLKSDTINPNSGSYTSRYDFENESTNSELYKAYKESGANISPLQPMFPVVNVGGSALVDSRLYVYKYKTKLKTTITGFSLILSTAGSYVGDGYNGILLGRYSNDTIYIIGQTANSATFWQISANAVTQKPLTAPVTIYPGEYAIMPLYNNSSQTTAPAIEASYCSSLAKIFTFTGGWRISSYINGVSTPAAYYKYTGNVSGESAVPHIIFPY